MREGGALRCAYSIQPWKGILQSPRPDGSLAVFVPQAFYIPRGKPAPGVIHGGHDLDGLHLICLLRKRPDVSIKKVVLLVEGREEVFARVPSLEWHEAGVELILIELHNGARMEENAVKIRPVSYGAGSQFRWLQTGVEALLVCAGLDGLLSLHNCSAIPGSGI